jgi:hypothetical protein
MGTTACGARRGWDPRPQSPDETRGSGAVTIARPARASTISRSHRAVADEDGRRGVRRLAPWSRTEAGDDDCGAMGRSRPSGAYNAADTSRAAHPVQAAMRRSAFVGPRERVECRTGTTPARAIASPCTVAMPTRSGERTGTGPTANRSTSSMQAGLVSTRINSAGRRCPCVSADRRTARRHGIVPKNGRCGSRRGVEGEDDHCLKF